MQYNVEFDLTAQYANLAAVQAACPLIKDAWAYVVDAREETAVVIAMASVDAVLFAPNCNLTLTRTYAECVKELGKLVGV
jgi:hypothetical protein